MTRATGRATSRAARSAKLVRRALRAPDAPRSSARGYSTSRAARSTEAWPACRDLRPIPRAPRAQDPGNWATDLQGGAQYGYALLVVVLLSSVLAMFLQSLALRLGIVSERDLAQACRDAYPRVRSRAHARARLCAAPRPGVPRGCIWGALAQGGCPPLVRVLAAQTARCACRAPPSILPKTPRREPPPPQCGRPRIRRQASPLHVNLLAAGRAAAVSRRAVHASPC